MELVWTDKSMGQSYKISGNDKAAYAQAAAKIRSQIDTGHSVSKEALDILDKARYIGVHHG